MTPDELRRILIDAAVFGGTLTIIGLAVTSENWRFFVPSIVFVGFVLWRTNR